MAATKRPTSSRGMPGFSCWAGGFASGGEAGWATTCLEPENTSAMVKASPVLRSFWFVLTAISRSAYQPSTECNRVVGDEHSGHLCSALRSACLVEAQSGHGAPQGDHTQPRRT